MTQHNHDFRRSAAVRLSAISGLLGSVLGARKGPVGAALGGLAGGALGYVIGESIQRQQHHEDHRPVTIDVTHADASGSSTEGSDSQSTQSSGDR